MTTQRILATVPVRLGYSVIELSVVATTNKAPRLEIVEGKARFLVPESYDRKELEAKIEEHMPEIMKTISRRCLN